nr:hypothetical protein Itr_chr14CG29980 [Ipomoea trifida]
MDGVPMVSRIAALKSSNDHNGASPQPPVSSFALSTFVNRKMCQQSDTSLSVAAGEETLIELVITGCKVAEFADDPETTVDGALTTETAGVTGAELEATPEIVEGLELTGVTAVNCCSVEVPAAPIATLDVKPASPCGPGAAAFSACSRAN